MIRRKVESLRDLAASYDLVVNCTGVGAAQLVGDRSVVPTSGHVLRVRAPWINSAMGAVVNEDGDFAYIIPKYTVIHLFVVDVACVLFGAQSVCMVPNQNTRNIYHKQ